MKKAGVFIVFIVMVFATVTALTQSVPELINYQGRLTNNLGQPLADGSTVDLTFAFYGVESGQMPLYLSVLQEDVVVTGGIYNVLIGSGTITPGTESGLALAFQNHADVWMGVKVDADAEMTPRTRITSVPYAMTASVIDLNTLDLDGDGHYKTASSNTPNDDCNDLDPQVYPGHSDGCDKKDNDCDGIIDEDCPMHPNMVMIPAGCFNMGDAFSEGFSNELPVHNVCITSDFYMDVHEVTNAEYKACVDASACTAPGSSSSYSRGSYYGNPTYDNFPVIYVNWNQATAYCSWASKRLPTEAEWEYAARGGLAVKRFPWGDTISCADANYYANPSSFAYDTNGSDGYCIGDDTSQVESYAANGYGLCDMAGNVYDWVNDWYSSTYYSSSPTNDPPGPASGTSRVIRGGAWYAVPGDLRVSSHTASPATHDWGIGFRCAGD